MAEQSLKLSYGMSRRFEPYLPPKMQGRTLLMLALRFTQRRMKMAAEKLSAYILLRTGCSMCLVCDAKWTRCDD